MKLYFLALLITLVLTMIQFIYLNVWNMCAYMSYTFRH